MSTKMQTALADAGADIVIIISTWLITILSVTGVTFDSLVQQKSLIALVIALAAYAANWARNYRRTGDVIPPPLLTQQLSAISAQQERMTEVLVSVQQNTAAIKSHMPTEPPGPPAPVIPS